MSQLKPDFLIELAKACIVSREILEVVKPHLNYSYISGEEYKHVFKYIFDYHAATLKSPSIGLVAQNVTNKNTQEIIGKIREVNVYDSKEKIVESFEEYIKKARFHVLWKKTEDLFNAQKHDEAYSQLASESNEINGFSLKRNMLPRVYADFDKRQVERQNRDHTVKKIATGIPQLDYHTRGGVDRGTGILGVGRSGVGKTTFLRQLGGAASFRGVPVVHFAAGDSTEDEVGVGYDGYWTGVDLHIIKEGSLAGVDIRKIEKAKKDYLASCGEIYYKVFKQFNSATIRECREILIELLKEVPIGLAIFDYLEKFEPGDGKRYGTNDEGNRARKLATAEKIVNIATEFDIVVASMTQAADIPKENWNNANWVISRSNISNLRATIDSFAYAVTLNQTEDENDNDVMRIHEEKLRHYKIWSSESTYKIIQRRETGRFIDLAKTNERFWDVDNKKIIRNVPKA